MIHPILQCRKSEIELLCRQYRVRKLDVFGSAVTEEFDPATSDLDFMVTFEPSSSVMHSRRYFGLLFALEELFVRPVDLVEDGCIDNTHVLRTIEQQRCTLYAA